MNEMPKNGEFYKHFKGNIYQVKMLAWDSEKVEKMVVYQGMYPPFECYVRKLSEFISEVDKSKYPDSNQVYRFEKIDPAKLNREIVKTTREEQKVNSKAITNIEDGFLALLDAKTFKEKREIFIELKPYMTPLMLSNIAVALDIVLEEGDEEEQYESILKCLDTFEHYEGGRLR